MPFKAGGGTPLEANTTVLELQEKKADMDFQDWSRLGSRRGNLNRFIDVIEGSKSAVLADLRTQTM